MPGPILNLTIFTKSTTHTLRAICLATFIPAFIILLVHGIVSEDVNPAIGIIPMFFSSAYSAILLANERKCGCQASGLTGTPVHLALDMAVGIGLLVCLILDWVFMGNGSCNAGEVMLGTYGTNFMICNFLMHFYFVARQLQEAMGPGESYPMSCPQCQNRSFVGETIKMAKGWKDGYAPIVDRTVGRRLDGVEVHEGEAEALV